MARTIIFATLAVTMVCCQKRFISFFMLNSNFSFKFFSTGFCIRWSWGIGHVWTSKWTYQHPQCSHRMVADASILSWQRGILAEAKVCKSTQLVKSIATAFFVADLRDPFEFFSFFLFFWTLWFWKSPFSGIVGRNNFFLFLSFLFRCCVTTKLTNKEDLTVDENSVEVKEIQQIVEEINEISKNFETAYNDGTYRFAVS